MSLAVALVSLGCWATTSGVTFLFANGQKATFAFAVKPTIVVESDGLTVSSTDNASVSYTFAEVKKFYFDDDASTGISSAAAPASSQHPVISYAAGAVSVNGLKAGDRVAVVSVGGSVLANVQADANGSARIDLSSAAKGVYVVSAGRGVSFKLLKK